MSIPHVVRIKIGDWVRYLAREGSGRLFTNDLDLADYTDEPRAKENAKALRLLAQTKGARASVRVLSLDEAQAAAETTQQEAP